MKSIVGHFLLALSISLSAYAQESVSDLVPVTARGPEVTTDIAPTKDGKLASVDEATELFDSQLSVTLFSLGGMDKSQFNGSQPSMSFFDNFISFNYKVTKDFRISARPAFSYSTAGFDNRGNEVTNEMNSRDFSFVARFVHLFDGELPPKFDLANQFRLYLPTSSYSLDSGMIARLRYELEGYYYASRTWKMRYYVKPSYYFQRSTVYLDNSNPKFPNSVRTTPKVDIEHGGEASYKLSKRFAIKPAFEIKETWSNSSEAESKDTYRATKIRTGVGVEFQPNYSMNFTLAVQETRDLIATSFAPEPGFVLMTNVVLF